MNLIAALNDAYDHIPDAPQPGYSKQKISAVFVLRDDGTVKNIEDMRETSGKKLVPRQLDVPNPPVRTSGPRSCFLWDKTSYSLGITKEPTEKTRAHRECFVEHHQKLLAETQDEGLKAFLRFLDKWDPEERREDMPDGWHVDMLDENIIFILDSDKESKTYLHNRPAAKAIWAKANEAVPDGEKTLPFCPIIGLKAPTAMVHDSIRGVSGAQSSGAALVSFNKDAFTSYGHEQGENAQISVQAAEKYTGALNLFLDKGSGHNLLFGNYKDGTTLVFWAEVTKAAIAREAEASFSGIFGELPNEKDLIEKAEKEQVQKAEAFLKRVRDKRLSDEEPLMQLDVHFYILGLTPNAARLVIRFCLESSFGHIIRNYQRFISEMEINPPPRDLYPPFYQYLQETALRGEKKNIDSRLAAEWAKSILTGRYYPQTLFTTILGRIAHDRMGKNKTERVNALRASILRAVLMRNYNKGVKAMIDFECKSKGYLLGRLFAVFEQTQAAAIHAAFKDGVNASVLDRFYSSASKTPAKVFPHLIDNSKNHLRKLLKSSDPKEAGQGYNLDKIIGSIMESLTPQQGGFPQTIPLEEQGLFGIGYYHQRYGYQETLSNIKGEKE